VIKNIITVAAALVGIVSAGTAQAYVVDFGQSANATPSVPLTPDGFGEALDARSRFLGRSADPTAVQVVDFESYVAGDPLDFVFGSGAAEVKASLLGSGEMKETSIETLESGQYSVAASGTQGTKFWSARATPDGKAFELWFSRDVAQFGFFGIDIGDFRGVLELDLLDASGNEIGEPTTGSDDPSFEPLLCEPAGSFCSPADGSVLYFGVTATSSAEYFRGVRFRSVGSTSIDSADLFSFDSFTVVGAPLPSPVSAPGTLALLGTALVGLALLRRRA
jgi:hypothetical protein